MMFDKILMCECNIDKIISREINFVARLDFEGCDCVEDHKVFAVFCKNWCYNVVGRLLPLLNYSVQKVWIRPEHVPLEFQLEKIDKYLTKGLTVNPILFYFEDAILIWINLDTIHWGIFFRQRSNVNRLGKNPRWWEILMLLSFSAGRVLLEVLASLFLNTTTVDFIDFVCTRNNQYSSYIEVISRDKSLLFSCAKHFKQCLYFEYLVFAHYTTRLKVNILR